MFWYVCRKVLSYVCFLFLLFLTLGCGLDKKNLAKLPRPSGSEVSLTSDYPSVVKVILPGGYGMCSGAFISPNTVLTAAHCTLNSGTYTVSSSFGTFTTSTKENHGSGVLNDPNDISVLIFSSDVADRDLGYVSDLGSTVHSDETVRIVGYGCNSMSSRTGSGYKRTGTNMIYDITDYIELITPKLSGRGIIGDDNRAGSCFGDSGGPMFRNSLVVGVAHAGGSFDRNNYISEYVNITRSDNRSFLNSVNNTHDLGIQGL